MLTLAAFLLHRERVKLDTKPGHRPGLCTVCVTQDEEKAVEEDTMSHDHTL